MVVIDLAPMTHTFTIPTLLPELNEYINAERSNRYRAAKIKKTATATCHYSCLNLRYKVNQNFRYDVRIIWYLPDRRKDPDGVSFAIKFILDGLVSAKVLKNDGAKNIGSITHDFIYGKGSKVVVELKERIL